MNVGHMSLLSPAVAKSSMCAAAMALRPNLLLTDAAFAGLPPGVCSTDKDCPGGECNLKNVAKVCRCVSGVDVCQTFPPTGRCQSKPPTLAELPK